MWTRSWSTSLRALVSAVAVTPSVSSTMSSIFLRHLPADLVQVELGAAEHVLAEGGGGAGERGQEPDLDGSALGHGRRRAREGQGQGGDEGKQAGQHDGPPMISAAGRGARPRRHAGRRG